MASLLKVNEIQTVAGKPILNSTGSILQVKSVTKTDATSTSSQTFGDVSGLSISITPSSTSSKILVIGTINCSESGDYAYVRLMRDSTAIAIGDAANTAYVNRSVNDRDTAHYEPRNASNLTVMEISA